MFRRFYNTFYFERRTYLLNAPKQYVIEQLDKLFRDRGEFSEYPNLTGKFSEYPIKFSLVTEWRFVIVQYIEQKSAYLKGTIIELEPNKTQIRVSVRPNSIFGVWFMIFAIFGTYNLFGAFTSRGQGDNLYLGIFLLISLPVLHAFAKAYSDRLISAFEKYLDVEQIQKSIK